MRNNILTISAIFTLTLTIPTQISFAMDVSDTYQLSRQVKIELPLNTKRNIESAEAAIANCDEAAFNSALNNLREQQESLESQAKAKNITPWNTEEQMSQAHTFAENVAATRQTLQNQWRAAQPCGEEKKKEASGTQSELETALQNYERDVANDDLPVSRDYDPELTGTDAWYDAVSLSFEFFAGLFKPDSLNGYLGSEVAATPSTRTLGDVSVEENGSIFGLNSELRLPLGEVPNAMPNIMPNLFPNLYGQRRVANPLQLILGIDIERADLDGAQDTYVTGGRDLLLPGVGVGPNPSGFTVGAANSTVTNILYHSDYDYNRYNIGLGKDIDVPNSEDSLTLRPSGGLQYGDFESWQTFSGITNSGTLPFSYDTGVKNNFFAPYVGLYISARPQVLSNVFQVPIEVTTGFRYAYVFNDADGSDTLAVTGFTPGTADLSNDDNTHDFSAKLGITVLPDGPFNVTLGGEFESIGNVPDVSRDGTVPSQLSFEDAHNFTGTIRGTFRF